MFSYAIYTLESIKEHRDVRLFGLPLGICPITQTTKVSPGGWSNVPEILTTQGGYTQVELKIQKRRTVNRIMEDGRVKEFVFLLPMMMEPWRLWPVIPPCPKQSGLCVAEPIYIVSFPFLFHPHILFPLLVAPLRYLPPSRYLSQSVSFGHFSTCSFHTHVHVCSIRLMSSPVPLHGEFM